MVNNTTLPILSLVCLFTSISVLGQENSTWYSYGMEGDKQKITEYKDIITYESVREEESPYPARVDTVFIEKRINDSIYIVTNRTREGAIALMASRWLQDGAIKSIGIYYPRDDFESLETTYKEKGLPAWQELTRRWVFSEAKTKELDQAPGYDEVTREAMLGALSIRKEVTPYIKQYMTDNPDTQSWRMYRFVEVKAQQKFIELGYNPYKRVPYNFEKQFEGDEEIIKALTEPMSFE
ncbi:hypothetical protein [Flagellimonas sp.]|uniref:hypothetical protein n=1 Tax=Flagellimonas sp. TaxID=2058762 RepID=UPI003F4A4071